MPLGFFRLSCLALISGIILGLSVSVLLSEVSQSYKVVLFFLLIIFLSNLLAKLAILYGEIFAQM